LIFSDKTDTLCTGSDHATLGISIMFTMTTLLKRSTLLPATALAAALMLAACGSGGGSSSSTPTTPTDPTTPVNPTNPTTKTSVEGYWGGSVGPSFDMAGSVLENGEYWFLISTSSNTPTPGRIFALIHGSGQSVSSKFSSNNAKYFPQGIEQGAVASSSGTLGSTTAYTVDSSFPGSASFTYPNPADNGGFSFTLAFDPAYYNPVTTLESVGSWRGANQAISVNEIFAFDITSNANGNGSFTLTYDAVSSQPGCRATGTIVPRPGGKRVYNVTMNYGGSPCLLPNSTFTGIAQPTFRQTTATQRLVMTAIDSTNSYSFIGVIDRLN
jgi:hypothetical protein